MKLRVLEMGKTEDELHHSIYKTPSFTDGCLEIRLFYVRITPCVAKNLPEQLTLYYLRRESGVFLEINGARIPSSDAVSITLRRDRVDKDCSDCSDVTYISTDSARFLGHLEFEVYEEGKGMNLILCGSFQRVDAALENNSKTGWSIDCYASNAITEKIGVSSPSIEVYVAGCCSRIPVILTETILVTSRRKTSRKGMLDAIPENEEVGRSLNNESIQQQQQQSLQLMEADREDHESDWKLTHNYYSDDMYFGDDGMLSWFNAGVRVGVGIGLGMFVGAGLLMRSYQAATWSFRRRFF